MSFLICGKSPITWAYEICAKLSDQPKWDFEDSLEQDDPQRFSCKCTIVNDINQSVTAMGFGRSKKEAQREAAVNMLYVELEMTDDVLLERCKGYEESAITANYNPQFKIENKEDEELDPVSDTDDNELLVCDEPRHALGSICCAFQMKEPVYTETKVEGPEHNPIRTISCSISYRGKDLCFSGRRRSKDDASKVAALRVLHELEKNPAWLICGAGSSSGVQDPSGIDNFLAECLAFFKKIVCNFEAKENERGGQPRPTGE